MSQKKFGDPCVVKLSGLPIKAVDAHIGIKQKCVFSGRNRIKAAAVSFYLNGKGVLKGNCFAAPDVGDKIFSRRQAECFCGKSHFDGVLFNIEKSCRPQRHQSVVFFNGKVGCLEVDDPGNEIFSVAIIVSAEEHLLAVVGIAHSLFQSLEPGIVRSRLAEFSGDLNHGVSGKAVVQAEHGLCIIESGEESHRVAVGHKEMGCMSGKTGSTPEEVGLDIIPVAVADINAVTVVCKIFSKEGITHDDIASGLKITVAGDPFADLLKPPGAVLVTGTVFVLQKVMTVFKSIAPEVMLHALKAVLVKEDIQGMTDILPHLFLTDIQRRRVSCPVVVIDEPLRMLLINGGVFGAESADPDGGTQTDPADLIGLSAQSPGELFVIYARLPFIGHSQTVSGGNVNSISVIHLDPADCGKILFEESCFFQDHFLRDLP